MPRGNRSTDAVGRHAYDGLDRVLHEKARLGILTSLLTYPDGLVFNDLKDLCSLTDGNLSRHLQVLSQEGLVQIWKGYDENRPQTLCRLSPKGRKRFIAYLEELEKVLKDATAAARASTERSKRLHGGLAPA